jgi:hypothetical protein
MLLANKGCKGSTLIVQLVSSFDKCHYVTQACKRKKEKEKRKQKTEKSKEG